MRPRMSGTRPGGIWSNPAGGHTALATLKVDPNVPRAPPQVIARLKRAIERAQRPYRTVPLDGNTLDKVLY